MSTTMDFLLESARWLQVTNFSLAIAESDWMFQALETVHVLAITLVVGSIAMVDLRLLGYFARERSVTELTREALPWTWIAFVCALISGAMLFASKAVAYYENWPFRFKLLFLGLAGVNMLFFHYNTYRSVGTWNVGRAPVSARCAGALSLLVWVAIVTLGRWIGFTTK